MTVFVRGEAVKTYDRRTRLQLDRRQAAGGRRRDAGGPLPRRRRAWTTCRPIYYKALLHRLPERRATAREFARAAKQRRPAGVGARIGGLIEIHGGGGRRQRLDQRLRGRDQRRDGPACSDRVGRGHARDHRRERRAMEPIAEFAGRQRAGAGRPAALSPVAARRRPPERPLAPPAASPPAVARVGSAAHRHAPSRHRRGGRASLLAACSRGRHRLPVPSRTSSEPLARLGRGAVRRPSS
ncbi:MAG: hypothetical protein MZV70_43400 [Desulfobacterales bacterium]|nr:hypothetical protein [Desulfobacterales bacterium]